MHRSLPVVLAALVAIAACTDTTSVTTASPTPTDVESTASDTATTTTPAISSTTSSGATETTLSTTTAPATTTTAQPTSTTADVRYSIGVHGLHPFPPLPGSDGWFGSGCAPGSDALPDGIWWGYIEDLTPRSITFDLACLRWIDDPNDDGIEEGGWDIRNVNPKTRQVPVHPDAQAMCDLWGCPPALFPYPDWMERAPVMPTMLDEGVWLYINDGVVTEVGEGVLAG